MDILRGMFETWIKIGRTSNVWDAYNSSSRITRGSWIVWHGCSQRDTTVKCQKKDNEEVPYGEIIPRRLNCEKSVLQLHSQSFYLVATHSDGQSEL
jgi:hypothetical protein